MKSIILSICLLASISVFANSDSVKVLNAAEFLSIVTNYHPIAKQAGLITEQAKAELVIARGGFDPYIYSDYDRKNFDGKNYYSLFGNEIKVPGWYGLELKAGYDIAYGVNINPENSIPQGGLGYIGISANVLKGMIMDKRMAALKQAKIFRESSEQERLIILNDLLLDANKAYYEWSQSYQNLLIFENALKLAEVRFTATKQTYVLGDRPAIDTIEALTQFQSRQYQYNEAKLQFIKSGLELSNFLWYDNDVPVQLTDSIVPETLTSGFTQLSISLAKAEEFESQLKTVNPYLQTYNYKLKMLDIERRLKIENLKPTLNVNYNLLSKQFNMFTEGSPAIFRNDYKFGLMFSMPLTFAQARGELKLNKLKIKDTQYTINQKTLELVNKLKAYYNELVITQQQVVIYEDMVLNMQKLFSGEDQRFRNGESSLFLVNARENNMLNTQMKLRELQAKFYKTEAAVKWAIGMLPQNTSLKY
jgi:outer membrane protein TolC